jgi:plastocyanin
MKKLLALPSLVLLIVTVAACGDDGTDTTPPANGQVSESVAVDDFSFEPATITVPTGAGVTLTLDNVGEFDHTWTLLGDGPSVDAAAGLDPGRILAEAVVAVGASETLTFTAPAAGLYQVICTVEGHLELGMEGTLIVQG